MEEMILVAGIDKGEVCWLRHCLRENDYRSIPCESVERIIEELVILPTCDVTVSLVLIELEILREISDDLIAKLSELALDVPFALFNETREEADLLEIFDSICEGRALFKQQENCKLTQMLWSNGVSVPLGMVS